MIILAWLISTTLWLTIWLPFVTLGYLTTWLGLLFCNRASEHMPRLWWPWDSVTGINGTICFRNLDWVIECNKDDWHFSSPETAKRIVAHHLGRERTYPARWLWVTVRRPADNIARWLLGRAQPRDTRVSRRTWTLGAASLVRDLAATPAGWLYTLTLPYTSTRALRYRFGWKWHEIQLGRAHFIYQITRENIA